LLWLYGDNDADPQFGQRLRFKRLPRERRCDRERDPAQKTHWAEVARDMAGLGVRTGLILK
jgi:hypothetical protein